MHRTNRTKFRQQVLNPLLEAGLIAMTIPDKPCSIKQRYRLTAAGRSLLTSLKTESLKTMAKPKLELTWIGKDTRPKLEPRILLEDTSKSLHAAQRVTENDIFDNRLIFGDNLLALKALEWQQTWGKAMVGSVLLFRALIGDLPTL